jgi:glycosyltransferase involved in cell wall biosynthesis
VRVAFVHDWLVTYRGGEKVLESLLQLYPEAPIFTLFHDPKAMPESINRRRIILPRGLKILRRFRKLLLPFLPSIVESFDLSGYDLIISSSSCVAKGVIPDPTAKHLCYLHSPMRYIWDQRQEYLEQFAFLPLARFKVNYLSSFLRTWDVTSANRVDSFLVNSHFVGQRVAKYYRRESVVVHPPVALADFATPTKPVAASGGYFFAAGAFVSYKRFDIAIDACERLGMKLIIAGSGPFEQTLRKRAGKNTTFIIKPDDRQWRELLKNASAFLLPAVEDFGLIPIEALASGTPVLALQAGGALDYVKPGVNGEFFKEQTPESLVGVLKTFDAKSYPASTVTASAASFDDHHFKSKVKQHISLLMEQH